eukprot:m.174145 g.174145  ORF g.174145 m.174145 type:complete len:742 (-) comp13793_c0_seq1:370-2595(-)
MASLKIPSNTKLASRSGLGARSSKSMLAANSLVRSRSRVGGGSRVGFNDRGGADGDEEWLQAREPVKPDDQLELTEEELKVEHTRILRGENPQAPDNIVRFSFKESEYKAIAQVEQLAMHFKLDGNMIHEDSDEARRQRARENVRSRKPVATTTATSTTDMGTGVGDVDPEADATIDTTADEGVEGDEGTEGDEATADEDGEPTQATGPPKKLRNQFNFSERASQTFNYTTKERGVATVPPPRSNFSALATQGIIYDAYAAEEARKAALKEKNPQQDRAKSKSKAPSGFDPSRAAAAAGDSEPSIWAAAAKVVTLAEAKKVERMVLQNVYDSVLLDFKYYENGADQYLSVTEEGGSSVLPLWKFSTSEYKRHNVTCVSFIPGSSDLIVVGFGSYDYLKQGTGAVACFSFKNPVTPEFLIPTESGVTSVDPMPDKPHLLCVGCYDGSVAVYNLACPDEAQRMQPTHKSTALTGKHTDPVWQVQWQPDDLDKCHNFYSVSADSLVRGWTMVKNELQYRDVIELTSSEKEADATDMEATKFAGTCFAFNPTQEHLYLVGTEEGRIMKCSKAYNAKFLSVYKAHAMAVYGLKWNPFHSGVFVSCSADWTVKVWDHDYPLCLFEFDLGAAVGDVAWAPYSSTQFAAVTANGFLHIFDLAVSKTEAVHVSQIIKRGGKLTHVSFNKDYPVLVIGDDRGNVTSFKLSPNLRKNFATRDSEAEVQKLDKLLESMKELDIQTGKPLFGSA